MGQPKRKTTIRASGESPSSQPPLEATPRPALTEISGNGKKINRKKISQGGEMFGRLVAVRRAGLGLSQEDLAARMDTSQSSVARIEEGHPPSTEALQRLTAALDVEPGKDALRRSIARATASGNGARTPWKPLGGRWLWGGLAIAVLVPLLVILGGRSASTDGDDPSPQSPQAVSAVPAVPVAVEESQKKAQKTKKAQSKDASAASKEKASTPAPASFDNGGSSEVPGEPVSKPVTSSPPAPSGGGSKGPPPQVQHGIRIGDG